MSSTAIGEGNIVLEARTLYDQQLGLVPNN